MENILPLIKRTHAASTALVKLSNAELKSILTDLANTLVEKSPLLLKANAVDIARQAADDPRNDRLLLTSDRIKNIAASIKKIAALPDPTGRVLEKKQLPNGLRLSKMSVPLGVVGAIYESRPNVTFDIAALCLRSRNACVLKGSIDAENTNKVAVKLIHNVLRKHKVNADVVCLLPSAREVVDQLFTATKYIDVLIPRGSEGLIRHVRRNSLVPTIETGAGVCHVYIEKSANISKAVKIAVNAKVSRPSVCNAADAFLVDKAVAKEFIPRLQEEFEKAGVEIFADASAQKILKGYPFLHAAEEEHFGKEYLSLKCAIKVVKDFDEALAHIAEFSTRHSEAIVSENKEVQARFINEVDAAAVYTNASTRFTDGEEFGLGAEIGISTQKLHARGPFALEKLVTEKWIVRGNGQVR